MDVSRHLPIIENSTPESALPPRYAQWMMSLLGAPIPSETEATCDDCAMCGDEGQTALPGVFFDPSVKCCTYLPELSNFLVGDILRDPTPDYPEGRDSLLARVASGLGVSPLGVMQTGHFKNTFQNTVSGFGHSHALRCPHFVDRDGGRCGIWRHREATCATWYCKHVRGATARSFWSRLHQLLFSVERGLARHCALELGVPAVALRELFPVYSPRDRPEVVSAADLDGHADPERHALIWGPWQGRESEYFIACAARIHGLSWDDVVRVCGSETGVFASIVKAMFERLVSEKTPTHARPGSFQVLGMTKQVYRVVSYSPLDPRDLPRALIDVLPEFLDRTTTEALEYIRGTLKLEVTEDDVRKLVDFQLLVPQS